MDDPSSLLLSAIEETERVAQQAADDGIDTWKPEDPAFWWNTDHPMTRAERHLIAANDPSSVLRRCAADRELVDLHGIVHRNIGWLEWDEGEHAEMYAELPVCGLCVPRHSSFPRREDVPEGPCRTVRILAEGYGIAVDQEGGHRG